MADFYTIIRLLGEEIALGLPGWDAQKMMIAPGREKMEMERIEKNNPKKSSVLVWLYPKDNEIYTRLILRTQIGKVHGGQVAFPGGRVEKEDRDLWATALREAHEEIGLPPEKLKRVGELSPVYIPPSNFWVHPFIAYSDTELSSVIQASEVQRTIDMNIGLLLDPEIKEEKIIVHSNSAVGKATPYYNIQGYTVWGATAMILSELEALVVRVYSRVE